MKKHLVRILILILILGIIGVGIFFIVKRSKSTPLYEASCNFILSEDTEILTTKITLAQELYDDNISGETRLITLQNIITKIDSFESDLNSYLVFCKAKPIKTYKLSKTYSDLISLRKYLIVDYNEYITRMSGNTNADGNMLEKLYNELFDHTLKYVQKYNSCFKSTTNYVFTKTYKVDTLKHEIYNLYALGVENLISGVSNNRFSSTTLITRLNNGLNLSSNILTLPESVEGGEFSPEALAFKKYFNASNKANLIENFNVYYASTINPTTETSNEKLAVYYAKQLGV